MDALRSVGMFFLALTIAGIAALVIGMVLVGLEGALGTLAVIALIGVGGWMLGVQNHR